ncbi:MAG: hypothetical protein LUQ47_05690, partial [Methanotrichaceae archaeon]|nr:hypothetical protein [Methanotrichaceae archaeon]
MSRPEYRGTTIELRTYSPAEKAQFDEWAKKHGQPTSTFLLSKLRWMMDNEIYPTPIRPNRELELRAKIATLEQDLKLTKAALDKARLQVAFSTPPTGVVHDMDNRIISIFKMSGALPEEVLLSMLNIQEGEKELIKLLRRELEALESMGLIRKSS